MVFGKNVSGSNPLENMTYPLFSSPTFYMSGAVCTLMPYLRQSSWSCLSITVSGGMMIVVEPVLKASTIVVKIRRAS